MLKGIPLKTPKGQTRKTKWDLHIGPRTRETARGSFCGGRGANGCFERGATSCKTAISLEISNRPAVTYESGWEGFRRAFSG